MLYAQCVQSVLRAWYGLGAVRALNALYAQFVQYAPLDRYARYVRDFQLLFTTFISNDRRATVPVRRLSARCSAACRTSLPTWVPGHRIPSLPHGG